MHEPSFQITGASGLIGSWLVGQLSISCLAPIRSKEIGLLGVGPIDAANPQSQVVYYLIQLGREIDAGNPEQLMHFTPFVGRLAPTRRNLTAWRRHGAPRASSSSWIGRMRWRDFS